VWVDAVRLIIAYCPYYAMSVVRFDAERERSE